MASETTREAEKQSKKVRVRSWMCEKEQDSGRKRIRATEGSE